MLHKSVLLTESIENLNIKDGGIYVDATMGYGGHSKEILKKNKTGFLYGFDQDEYAVDYSNKFLKEFGTNFHIIKSNFANLKSELAKYGVEKIDGILFDLGVSSVQLDQDERGFSFHKDARLDMRMDRDNPISAYEVVNSYSLNDLIRILRDYGEEKYAVSIAKNIVKYRENKNIETTFELVDIIKKSMPMKAMRDGHPARKTFQAIRIEVNHELDVISVALKDAIDMLNVGGRICVITFQSLEDRIVKNTFREYSEVDSKIKNLPFIPSQYMPKLKIISKGIVASKEELDENYRAHSARLRVAEKIKD